MIRIRMYTHIDIYGCIIYTHTHTTRDSVAGATEGMPYLEKLRESILLNVSSRDLALLPTYDWCVGLVRLCACVCVCAGMEGGVCVPVRGRPRVQRQKTKEICASGGQKWNAQCVKRLVDIVSNIMPNGGPANG